MRQRFIKGEIIHAGDSVLFKLFRGSIGAGEGEFHLGRFAQSIFHLKRRLVDDDRGPALGELQLRSNRIYGQRRAIADIGPLARSVLGLHGQIIHAALGQVQSGQSSAELIQRIELGRKPGPALLGNHP